MHRLAPLRSFLILSLILFSSVALAQSQATTGVIEGTVTDATGGALPGVTITLHNTGTNFEQVQVTDSTGRFRGVLLPLGPYEASAKLDYNSAKSVTTKIYSK